MTKNHNNSYSWARIFNLIKQHKKPLILAHIIAFFATLVSVPLPLLLPVLVDEVLLNQPAWLIGMVQATTPTSWHSATFYIVFISLVTIFLRITGVGLGVWQMRQFTLISKDVTLGIREDLVKRVERVSMAHYESLGTGSVNSTLINDVNTIDTFLGTTVGKIIIAIFSLIGVTAILLWLNWQLALFILLLNPLVVYFTIKMGQAVKNLKKAENTALDAFQQALGETLDALEQVRASNQSKRFFGIIQQKSEAIKSHSAAFSWRSDAASRLSFMIFLIGFDIFRGVSMLMVVFSDLSIGQMMAVFGYLWFMMGPVQELLAIQYSFNAASGSLQRINSVLDLDQEKSFPNKVNPFHENQLVKLEVQNLKFSYKDKDSGADRKVLDDLSFVINPGEKLALVGASGGGKTTLVKLLLGFYQPDSGRILFNNTPTYELGYDLIRQKVSTVLQHPMLFNNTLRFNLTLGQEISDSACWDALKVAQLDRYVRGLDEQLDSIVGRNGVKLSGGQRQRIAIARMILQDPQVVIMDEATSALDMETERELYQDLASFLSERTTLIVAHRLSSIRQADRILVFEDGKIIESGAHQELLEKKGVYHSLYS